MTVNPINPSQQDQVITATRECIQRAEQLFEREFPLPRIRFDLSGRIAGMFRVRRRQQEIRYNPYLFGKYFDEISPTRYRTRSHTIWCPNCTDGGMFDHMVRSGKPSCANWVPSRR